MSETRPAIVVCPRCKHANHIGLPRYRPGDTVSLICDGCKAQLTVSVRKDESDE